MPGPAILDHCRRQPGAWFKRILIILIAALALAGMLNLMHPRRIPWIEDWSHYVEAHAYREGLALIDRQGTRAAVESGAYMIFDARPEDDFLAGHLPGAFSLPDTDKDRRLDEYLPLLSPEQPILTYCTGGQCDDSVQLAMIFRDLGFTQVVVYAGGWTDWILHGGAVEQ